jgi:hypothetical protein
MNDLLLSLLLAGRRFHGNEGRLCAQTPTVWPPPFFNNNNDRKKNIITIFQYED